MLNQEIFVPFLGKGDQFPFYIFSDIILKVLILPLLTFFIILRGVTYNSKSLYKYALISSGISFIFALLLTWYVSFTKNGFQDVAHFAFIPSFSFSLRLGVDGISIFFILLTNFFIFLCILSLSPKSPRLHEALLYLFFLQWSVLASFLLLDLRGFFLFFEITLIPIYFLVLLWGSRERRTRASYLIAIYTLLGSIFRFFNILYLYSKTGTTDYELRLQIWFTEEDQRFLWITFFLAFAAKIPLFPFHIWLPEAHVEAPTVGSVLLAVLRLKLGTYGLIRFAIPLFPEGTSYFAPFAITFAIIGIIYTCFTAIRQIDLKKIIAYSSVGHINVVLLGILAEISESFQGALFQRLSHGVVSGALFFCVGSLYERYSVRSVKYFGGLAHFYPLFTRCFLIFSLANIGFPLTSSFVGEFYIFVGLVRYNFWATFFSATSIVLGAIYTLWSFNRIFFGNLSNQSISLYLDLNKKECALFIPLIISLFIIGLKPHLLIDVFFIDNINILEHAQLGRKLVKLNVSTFCK